MEEILLVKRAIKGDREAFENLINMYFDQLYKEAYLRCKHEENAKEIVQETIYKAYKNIKSLKEAKYFKTWISRILINVSNDYMSKYSMIEFQHDKNDYIKEVHKDDKIEIKIDLYNAMNELEAKYKDVIILRYLEDLKIEEISQILERPVNTIKTYIRKAIKDMKNLLKEDYIND